MTKAAWRQHLKSRRWSRYVSLPDQVHDPVRSPFPDLALAPGLESVLPTAGEWEAAYLSMADEPSTDALLRLMAAREIRLLVPAPGGSLSDQTWAEVEGATCALPASREGELPQPTGPRLPATALSGCRLILAPALAVDRSGTRLGRGGGWYDRALAHAGREALVLGVCFPDELLPAGALPREPHDRPVDGVLTGQGVVLF
jgi:5-formyltetrahydrofolate cyclo-ligase